MYRFRSVALIGIDGSGKTTQAKLLCERLRRNGIRPVYAHPYGHPLLRFLSPQIFARSGAVPADRRGGPIRRALTALFEVTESVAYLWGLHLACVLISITGRRIVWLVSDRAIDSLLAKHHWQNSLPLTLLDVLYRMAPRSKTKIWLRIPPQVAAERDHDFLPDAYREMDEAHAALSQHLGWIEIPCDRLPADVLLELILDRAHLRELLDRNQGGG